MKIRLKMKMFEKGFHWVMSIFIEGEIFLNNFIGEIFTWLISSKFIDWFK